MPEEEWAVGIAEVKAAEGRGRLAAYGLGSCVGLTLYDRTRRIGGMAHIMLPSSRLGPKGVLVPGKYADTAVESLLGLLGGRGADLGALEAKLVGGANMFLSVPQQAIPIGMRNVAAVRDQLDKRGVRIKAEEVGGGQGRTLFFYLEDGRLEVRRMNKPSLFL